jgi:hypothetical protein
MQRRSVACKVHSSVSSNCATKEKVTKVLLLIAHDLSVLLCFLFKHVLFCCCMSAPRKGNCCRHNQHVHAAELWGSLALQHNTQCLYVWPWIHFGIGKRFQCSSTLHSRTTTGTTTSAHWVTWSQTVTPSSQGESQGCKNDYSV